MPWPNTLWSNGDHNFPNFVIYFMYGILLIFGRYSRRITQEHANNFKGMHFTSASSQWKVK